MTKESSPVETDPKKNSNTLVQLLRVRYPDMTLNDFNSLCGQLRVLLIGRSICWNPLHEEQDQIFSITEAKADQSPGGYYVILTGNNHSISDASDGRSRILLEFEPLEKIYIQETLTAEREPVINPGCSHWCDLTFLIPVRDTTLNSARNQFST